MITVRRATDWSRCCMCPRPLVSRQHRQMPWSVDLATCAKQRHPKLAWQVKIKCSKCPFICQIVGPALSLVLHRIWAHILSLEIRVDFTCLCFLGGLWKTYFIALLNDDQVWSCQWNIWCIEDVNICGIYAALKLWLIQKICLTQEWSR